MADLEPLLATVPVLAGRIHGAAKLSELMRNNALPQVCPAAFVLPLGLRGGRADAVTGLFRQEIEWLEGVLLVVRAAGDATGARAKAELRPLIDAVIHAIAGAAGSGGPDDFGTWVLRKGELVSLSAGTLTYQIDFAIDDQLRIAR
ncbi:MAG: hypothetical protein VYB32_06250 [Pseudomonadota bacterium]|nr:hypothetical protein [Pseudomonadota bacterium]